MLEGTINSSYSLKKALGKVNEPNKLYKAMKEIEELIAEYEKKNPYPSKYSSIQEYYNSFFEDVMFGINDYRMESNNEVEEAREYFKNMNEYIEENAEFCGLE